MTCSCSRETSQLLSSLRALLALGVGLAMAAPSWCVVRGGAWGDDIFGQPTALTIRRPKTVPGYGCLKCYTGVCQIVGGVISPLLANVYLHSVLDVWFEQEVKPCLKGRAFLVRYADDFVMGFACEEDARRVLAVLPKRLDKYGLTIHPDKTRLVPFERPGGRPPAAGFEAGTRAGSFDFLGFTHYWSRSKAGNWVVKRKTAGSRFHRAVRKIAEWCRRNRHLPLREQHRALIQKLRGHYQYYGVIGNLDSLKRFRYEVMCQWRKWLSRRKRRGQIPWQQFLGCAEGLQTAVAGGGVTERSEARDLTSRMP